MQSILLTAIVNNYTNVALSIDLGF